MLARKTWKLHSLPTWMACSLAMRFKSFFYVCANASFTHAAQPFDRRLPCG